MNLSYISSKILSKAEKIPWKGILTSVPVWALFLINFTRSWVFAMMITEIPQYFADVFTLNVATVSNRFYKLIKGKAILTRLLLL